MTEPMPEPADHLPATRRAALLALADAIERGGWPNHGAAPDIRDMAQLYPTEDAERTEVEQLYAELSDALDVRLKMHEAVADRDRLTEELRQQQLRQQLAEREVTDLREQLVALADLGDVSDGDHTFRELYDHRAALFAALARAFPGLAWRSRQHHPGGDAMFPGYFIAGMALPVDGVGYEQVTYHCRAEAWGWFAGVPEREHAPEWDGHTPADVIDRLNASTLSNAEPAADLQAEVFRLQHLLYGDAGPDASDPDDGDVCADVAIDGDPIPAACHVEHQGAFCRARAHIHCAGTGTCAVDGAPVPCSCACHGAVVGATA